MSTELNTYKVVSYHSVSVDDYERGELENVDGYELSKEVKATDWKDAIQKYFDEFLCYKFNLKDAHIDEEYNNLQYSILVNKDNEEASEVEIERWKKGKQKLFIDNTIIMVKQIVNVILA